jgi:hypothetical protein
MLELLEMLPLHRPKEPSQDCPSGRWIDLRVILLIPLPQSRKEGPPPSLCRVRSADPVQTLIGAPEYRCGATISAKGMIGCVHERRLSFDMIIEVGQKPSGEEKSQVLLRYVHVCI